MRALAALLLVAALATSACSGGTDDAEEASPAADPPALGAEAAGAALLQTADLPEGFREADSGASAVATAGQPGCLAALDDLDSLDVTTKARTVFTDGDAVGVLSSVASDDDVDRLRAALDDLRSSLADCDEVTSDESDYEIKLAVSTNDVAADDAVEDQLNVTTSGTLRASGGEPVTYQASFSIFLVGSALATVGAFQVGDTSSGVIGRLGPLTETVVDRVGDAA